MKIAYTGANGQLGRALSKVLPDANGLTREELDLTSSSLVIQEKIFDLSPDILINCAAYTAVDKAETEPELAYKVNAGAVGTMALACEKIGARLVQISTDYVLGEGAKSVYGMTKQEGEQRARMTPYHLIIRTSWVFGDGRNFVKAILERGRAKGEVSVVNDQLGRPAYAADLAKVIAGLLTAELPSQTLLHFQNSGPIISWAQFAVEIFAQAGLSVPVKEISTIDYMAAQGGFVAPRNSNSAFDLTPLENLGIKVRPWQEALAEYLPTVLS